MGQRSAPILLGIAPNRQRRSRRPGLRERLFDRWLTDPGMGRALMRHRRELAGDVLTDPDLAAAERLRAMSTGTFVECSPCGHPRGETIGASQL